MMPEKARVSGLSMRIGAGLDACAASYAAASLARMSASGAGAGAAPSPRSMSATAMPLLSATQFSQSDRCLCTPLACCTELSRACVLECLLHVLRNLTPGRQMATAC